jgi:hypothetical protein
MTERLIFGRLDDVQELVVPDAEPISVAEVKASLGIAFTAHDVEIGRLITSCRRAAEEVLNVSLTGKLVSVLWEMFYDSLPLPYMPLADVPLLTVTDLDNITIDSASYDVYSVGSNSLFKGDFPNGVKLTYTTKALVDIKINEKLIDAVGSCLEQDMTSAEAIRKHFR